MIFRNIPFRTNIVLVLPSLRFLERDHAITNLLVFCSIKDLFSPSNCILYENNIGKSSDVDTVTPLLQRNVQPFLFFCFCFYPTENRLETDWFHIYISPISQRNSFKSPPSSPFKFKFKSFRRVRKWGKDIFVIFVTDNPSPLR